MSRTVWVEIDGIGAVHTFGWGPTRTLPATDGATLTGLGVSGAGFDAARDTGQVLVTEINTVDGDDVVTTRDRWIITEVVSGGDAVNAARLSPRRQWRATTETITDLVPSTLAWVERKTRYVIHGGTPAWAPADGSWVEALHTVEGQTSQQVPDTGGVAAAPSLVVRLAYDAIAGYAPRQEVARLARYAYPVLRTSGNARIPVAIGYPWAHRGADGPVLPPVRGLHVVQSEVLYGQPPAEAEWDGQTSLGNVVSLIRAALDTDLSDVRDQGATVYTGWSSLRSSRLRIYTAALDEGDLRDARLLFAGYVSDTRMSDDGASLDASVTGLLSSASFRSAASLAATRQSLPDGTISVRSESRAPQYRWGAWGPFCAELETISFSRAATILRETYRVSDGPGITTGKALVGPIDDIGNARLNIGRWVATTIDTTRGTGTRGGGGMQERVFDVDPVEAWRISTPDRRRTRIAAVVGEGVVCHLYTPTGIYWLGWPDQDLEATEDEGTLYYTPARPTATHAVDALLQILTSTGTGTNRPDFAQFSPASRVVTSLPLGTFDAAPRAFGLGIPAEFIDFHTFLDWANRNPLAIVRDLVAFEDDSASLLEFMTRKILEPFCLAVGTGADGRIRLQDLSEWGEGAGLYDDAAAVYTGDDASAQCVLHAAPNQIPAVTWGISETPPAVSVSVSWRNNYASSTRPEHRPVEEVSTDSEILGSPEGYFSRLEPRRLQRDIEGGAYLPSVIRRQSALLLRKNLVPLPILTFDARAEIWTAEPGQAVVLEDLPVVPAPDGSRSVTTLVEVVSVTRRVIDSTAVRVVARMLDATAPGLRSAWAPGFRVVSASSASVVTVEPDAYTPDGSGAPRATDTAWAIVGLVVQLYDEHYTPRGAGVAAVASVAGNTITLATALPVTPDAGDILLPAPVDEQPPAVRALFAFIALGEQADPDDDYAVEWL